MKRPIVIIGVLFFVFGFVTWLGSVLIPYLRIACQLNVFSSYLVAFAFYISYTVMAVPSGFVLRWTGYKRGMALGLVVMACGALLFLPAAASRSYPVFLLGLFIQGTGLAILQTAANPYVTILGPIDSAARRISIMGICNGVAAMIAPFLIGSVVLADAMPAQRLDLDRLAHKVMAPYGIIAVVLLGLGVWIFFSALPEMYTDETEKDMVPGGETKSSIWGFPHLLFGVATLFLYVGVEVIAGDSILNYGLSQGLSLSAARLLPSATQLCMLAGYLIGIVLIPRWLSQVLALKLCAVLGLLCVFVVLATHGMVSVYGVALMGLANSLVWPSIWPLAIDGLGRFTATGSALLIMAIGGGAVLPLVYGWTAGHTTPQHAYWVVVPCYCCILSYGIYNTDRR